MPEIFEVKRIADYLKQGGIEGKKILQMNIYPGGEKILRSFSLKEWQDLLIGQRIVRVDTKAKYTFLSLSSGTMMWHYRFTGIPHLKGIDYNDQLHVIHSLPVDKQTERFCRIEWLLEDDLMLQFVDIRCLSEVQFYSTSVEECPPYERLAPDLAYFTPESYDEWIKRHTGRKSDLKSDLQNQETLPSGIGNYLACEILAHAGLNPWQRCNDLSESEYEALKKALLDVRQHCQEGPEYHWFLVFNRRFCRRCGHEIIRQKHRNNRSSQTTHYCPECQT